MTFFDVVGRYAFNSPIVGTVETTELFMGVIVYLGMAMTTQKRGHISVDLLTSNVGPRTRLLLAVLADLVSAVFVAFLSWRLWQIAKRTFDNNLITQIWEVPVYPAAYIMAAASSVMVIILFGQLWVTIGQFVRPAAGNA
ncbi:MAG: TRAP transporter small permease [Alphaproteobacteria bacterium]